MQLPAANYRVLVGSETVRIVSATRILIKRPYVGPRGKRSVMIYGVNIVLKPSAAMFVGLDFPIDVARRIFGADTP